MQQAGGGEQGRKSTDASLKSPFGSKCRMQNGLRLCIYGQRLQSDVVCLTYHDLVSTM